VVVKDGNRVFLRAVGAGHLPMGTSDRMRVQLSEGLLVATMVAGDLLFGLFLRLIFTGSLSSLFLSLFSFAGFL
jgi:hypothetical protein